MDVNANASGDKEPSTNNAAYRERKARKKNWILLSNRKKRKIKCKRCKRVVDNYLMSLLLSPFAFLPSVLII